MSLVELLFYGGTGLVIAGAFLNAYKYREGFLLWIISSFILIWQAFILKAYNIVFMEVFFIFMAIFGFYKWSKPQNK